MNINLNKTSTILIIEWYKLLNCPDSFSRLLSAVIAADLGLHIIETFFFSSSWRIVQN